MKYAFLGLVFLAVLFTPTIAAPLERVDHALAKRPLNLTFTPVDSVDILVDVEHGASTQLQTSESRFSATLLKLGRDDDVVDAERLSRRDIRVAVRSADTYGGRHVVVSMPDSAVRALQQKGISQDNMPQYIRQNVHVADPNTGNRYQLVPDSNPREPVSTDSNTIMITLNLISSPSIEG